jgi:toxin-antitoxin system PIN domain toxin
MIALDSNILVYAHRADSGWHSQAASAIKQLAEGSSPWLIPWPCVHEFLAIVTHPRIYSPASPLQTAMEQVDLWLESPSLIVEGETSGYWENLRSALGQSKVVGPAIHDARVAAICQSHGVEALLTADRDFSRFGGLKTINPLIGK